MVAETGLRRSRDPHYGTFGEPIGSRENDLLTRLYTGRDLEPLAGIVPSLHEPTMDPAAIEHEHIALIVTDLHRHRREYRGRIVTV